MRLFSAIVMDMWKNRQGEVEQQRRRLENVVRQNRERLDRVDEAFLHERLEFRNGVPRGPGRFYTLRSETPRLAA